MAVTRKIYGRKANREFRLLRALAGDARIIANFCDWAKDFVAKGRWKPIGGQAEFSWVYAGDVWNASVVRDDRQWTATGNSVPNALYALAEGLEQLADVAREANPDE